MSVSNGFRSRISPKLSPLLPLNWAPEAPTQTFLGFLDANPFRITQFKHWIDPFEAVLAGKKCSRLEKIMWHSMRNHNKKLDEVANSSELLIVMISITTFFSNRKPVWSCCMSRATLWHQPPFAPGHFRLQNLRKPSKNLVSLWFP